MANLIRVGGGGAGSQYLRYDDVNDYVQALDTDGNWVDIYPTSQLPISAYPIGTVITFDYTGAIEEFTIPATGNWQLEVWGGKGSDNYADGYGNVGGKGGYTKGVKRFGIEDVIYIACGGQGSGWTAGYNGGGAGPASGGGATHIGLSNQLLKNTLIDDVIIVAGGGGGSAWCYGSDGSRGPGGDGGGLNGGSGGGVSHGGYSASGGGGGTQNNGGAAGGSGGGVAGGFGYGGNTSSHNGGAGGGGFYGGGGGGVSPAGANHGCSGGGGGSSYMNPSLTNTQTIAGQNNGDGKAKLTYLGI